tara:strand:+ start:672 stop:920 length:249 start_codon:yes stop_codon:yes gene_type:complete
MYYTKHSRKLRCDVTFFVPDEGGYLYVEIGDRPRQQACDGGYTTGATIYVLYMHASAGSFRRYFQQVCDRWYRSFIKDHPGY